MILDGPHFHHTPRGQKLIHFVKLPLLSYSQKIQPMEISASFLNHEIKVWQSQDCRVLGGRNFRVPVYSPSY